MARLVIDRALHGNTADTWPRWEEMLGIGAPAGFTAPSSTSSHSPRPSAGSSASSSALPGARDGVLLARSYDANRDPAEVCRAYDSEGQPLDGQLAAVRPQHRRQRRWPGGVRTPWNGQIGGGRGGPRGELQPFEGRRSLLAAPLSIAHRLQLVVELFDKQGRDGPIPFTDAIATSPAPSPTSAATCSARSSPSTGTSGDLDAVKAALSSSEVLAHSIDPGTHQAPPAPEGPPRTSFCNNCTAASPRRAMRTPGPRSSWPRPFACCRCTTGNRPSPNAPASSRGRVP